MSQNIFKNPYVSSPPILTGTGNGTLVIDRLTHFTITQTYTVTCTATNPFTVFQVVGSLDGAVGVAVVGTQFVDEDLKVFFTINQGSIPFQVGDQFVFSVNQGTDLNQQNIDTYDELPQKNFSQGILGQNAGDDNLRFLTSALYARAVIQDLEFVSKIAGLDGNNIKITYYDTGLPQKAFVDIQSLRFQAKTAGSAGNSISIEYEEHSPATQAYAIVQDIKWQSVQYGSIGNSISIEYIGGGTAGSEVVNVIGNLIQIQIENGVSTAWQIRQAVKNHPIAKTIISPVIVGSISNQQTITAGVIYLANGQDAIGLAGNEVVAVIGNHIKVKLESGFSTAQNIKNAIDSFPASSALVDVIITGLGTDAQSAPVPQTYLQGGQDSIGSPSNEIVSVNGYEIKVGFQSGVNTAQDIKNAIENNVFANALVNVNIIGSASNSQTAPASKFLSGGSILDTYFFNVNELSDTTNFFDGNGNLCVNFFTQLGDGYFRGSSRFKGVVSLDDLNSTTNDSGAPIPNLQRAVNKIFKDKNIIVGTEDNSPILWENNQLHFYSNIVLRFEENNVINRVLVSHSPISLNDGESIYLTINRVSSVNLTPTISATIPQGEDIVRLATRIGDCVILFDNTILRNGQKSRIGAAIDLTNQVYTLVDCSGKIYYDDSVLGRIYWDAPIKLKPLGSNSEITIFPDDIILDDDDVAFVQLDDPIVNSTKVVQKASRANILLNKPEIFWLFYRSGTKVYLRFGGELEQGEERNIGDTISDDIFLFIGSNGETDHSPNYSNAVLPLVANKFISDGENLVKSIKKLDIASSNLDIFIKQDRNLKLVEGGTWSFNASTNTITFTQDAYIQVPSIALSRNTIQSQSFVLNLNQIAYVNINRDAGAPSTLPIQVSDIDTFVPSEDSVIIARRVSNGVLIGSHCFLLKDGEHLELDGALAEINRYFSNLRLKPHESFNKKVRVTGSITQLLNNTKIAEILNEKILEFDGAVIDFITGDIFKSDGVTSLGDNFTPTIPPANEYLFYAISLVFNGSNANNSSSAKIKVDIGSSSNTDINQAHKPKFTGDKPIGYVWVKGNGVDIDAITNANFILINTGGGGSASNAGIDVYDEGILVSSGVTKLDFVGSNVNASLVGVGRVQVSISGSGGSSGGIGELTSNSDGQVNLNLSPIGENWVLQDSNLVRWKVKVLDDGTLVTESGVTDAITPLFKVTKQGGSGFATIRITTNGELYTDDVNVFGNLDDNFILKSPNNFCYKVGVNNLGQIVLTSVPKNYEFRITDENNLPYEISKIQDSGLLKYFRFYSSVAELPTPPQLINGMIAVAFVNTIYGIRQVYYDVSLASWRYTHDNTLVY